MRIIPGILLLSGITAFVLYFALCADSGEAPGVNEKGIVNEELDRLPHEVTVRNRKIVFDRSSASPRPREEYARLPYEIVIGEDVRLIESDVTLLPGESPVVFMERILADQMPPMEELDAYPESMYRYYVSFHPMDEDEAAARPSADRPDADPAEEGVSAYIRVMNFPDDSVGGRETRYDFIVSDGGDWILVWQGEGSFCRRPGQEFWQPADQLCP
ncbi:hypothetical protein QA596_07170 [Balneolales bacterium ANBcel1]|nr:hypothetical protein [Balneolales bacterium ANBcel1]